MKIVVADQNLVGLRDELEAALPTGSEVVWSPTRDVADVAALVPGAEVLISGRCSKEVATAGPQLRLVHAAGAGTDGIDVDALPAGCTVANTFHHEDSIAEYVVASAIALRRGFLAQDTALRAGHWPTPAYDEAAPWMRSLAGATIGFVGFGHIGARSWDRLRVFGARGVAVSRRGAIDAGETGLDWAGPTADRLGDLLAVSDVVVVSAPLTPETEGMIGAAELASMKDSAVLVNVGRGPLVAERPLYEALRDGVIGGAAIDVWYGYPEPGSAHAEPSSLPFRELGNVLMTPHSSGLTHQTFAGRADDIGANVHRLAAGEAIRNVVAVAP
ncbi:D-3-phosphoglycerate dehydrogenase [Pseudonocardia sp. Ae168_Ps1]|uniref:2-hydroxyacid dehydrogenase n=1 Tax=unclassified Pseudonocardia TaxID=2619320 RepID=UPI00094B1CEC|nr:MULTISPECIES: 2-hydroxyacid dehydrogenase [unclassified Pseudonocardia]OLL72815.1 D-3-phosphoglycerate dehydrogenase [Pseudonocardia sp. Ae150A_Ps1]OLL78790.1 D-3-phosphoglycerate dehydrogenase [Pseudonocardia sp. Ae168_Ps1]OLL87084.1 D-3-phosphoglycerate dehydrogenase [Pseudonocardia sp. Ae263_Ps1]OLL92885.1 D-3-phosphoglycerate dehydrogenase [Pseudonocardia sp. Ae356_Ps1]